MLPTQLKPGTVFGQDFEILERLAQGGMGTVYVALQRSTGKKRAIKVMHAQYEGDDNARRRFIQEARAGASIDSDHIVEMVGAGIDADTNTPWIAMELLKGADLKSVMADRGMLPPGEVLEIFRQICHALGEAHKMGLVHRDLKPENIFLAVPRREGIAFTVKILDFGIAKLVRESTGNGTQTQAIGSPRWMSPEQADRGGPISPSTDVWALGLLAFYLLTGQVYWKTAHIEAPSVIGQMCEILMDPIAPASERAAEYGVAELLPPGFDEFFARCVNREGSARYGDANEALAGLEAVFAEEQPIELAAPRPRSMTPPRGVSLRPPTPATGTRGGGYSLEVPAPKGEQPFAFDATALADTSIPLPTASTVNPPPVKPWSRRVGPVLLAVLGPLGIAAAVMLGLRRAQPTVHTEHPAHVADAAAAPPAAPDAAIVVPETNPPAPDAAAAIVADVAAAPEAAVVVPATPDASVAARADARVAVRRADAGEAAPDAAGAPLSDDVTTAYTHTVLSQLRRRYDQFIRCYEQHATPTPGTQVRMNLHFSINPANGTPTAVGVNGGPPEVNRCVADSISQMTFQTPVMVTSPIFHDLHFQTSNDAPSPPPSPPAQAPEGAAP